MSDRAKEVKLSDGKRLLLTVVWNEEFAMTCIFGCVSRFRANTIWFQLIFQLSTWQWLNCLTFNKENPFFHFKLIIWTWITYYPCHSTQRQLSEGFISQQALRFSVTAKQARNELLGEIKTSKQKNWLRPL